MKFRTTKYNIVVGVLALLIVGIWASSGFILYCNLDSWADRGTFGDMFGAVNSLFSGLALAGVVYAILQQHLELRDHRKELQRTANAQAIAARLSALSAALSHEDSQANRVRGIERDNALKNAALIRGQIDDALAEAEKLKQPE